MDADVERRSNLDPRFRQTSSERLAFDEFGGDEVMAVRFADLMNREDVRVVKAEAARASCLKRRSRSLSSVRRTGRSFNATCRPSFVSCAR